MGLSSFHSQADGVLPVLVMNTVLFVTLFKNMLSSLLHMLGVVTTNSSSSNLDEDYSSSLENDTEVPPPRRKRRITTTKYVTLCRSRYDEQGEEDGSENDGGNDNIWSLMECCVCLNRFEGGEEVSELSCKHFFHKGCLDKWFHKQQTTCPLCRSIL